MSSDTDNRAILDRAADSIVKSYREHGVQVDHGEARERLRRNMIRQENKKPRQ